MRKSALIFLFLFSVFSPGATAQSPVRHFFVRGYLKDLVYLNPGANGSLTGNQLFHNRVNILWKPDSAWSVGVELRNRLYMGSAPGDDPQFARKLDPAGLLTPLSLFAQQDMVALHCMADRAWVQYSRGAWEVRAGRQRIHWGMSYLWNPLDWYNTWSWFDFDYEERPGSDAVRVRRYMGATSRAEAAVKFTRDMSQGVIAAQYLFNMKGTTLQLQAGKVRQDLAAGLGLATSVKQWGIKGEFAGFMPLRESDSAAASLTISAERSAGTKGTLLFAALYNSDSPSKLRNGSFNLLVSSPRQLSPVRTSFFMQAGYNVTPLTKMSLGVAAGPLDGTLVWIPSLDFSLSNRLELMMLSQVAFGDAGTGYTNLYQGHFLRLKLNY